MSTSILPKNSFLASKMKNLVKTLNKYEEPENHVVFEDGVLYTTPEKTTPATTEFLDGKINEVQNMLHNQTKPMIGGAQFHYASMRDSWRVVKLLLGL